MNGDDMKDPGRVLNLDRPRTFKTTWNTMRALQKEYGTAEKAFAKVAESDYDAILYVLWASQVDEEPLSLDALGALLTPDDFGAVFATAFELAGAQQPKPSLLRRVFRPNAKRPRR